MPTYQRSRIVRNSALCLDCDTEIESKHRHDFKHCKCGNIYVDGGKDYIRRGFMRESRMVDTSIHEEIEP